MATLVKQTADKDPGIMTIHRNDYKEYLYAAINVNIYKLGNGQYEFDSLVLPDFALENIHKADDDTKYGVLVAHIIKAYYNDNAAMAVIGNYLSDMTDEKYKKEFDEYQKVRKLAKQTAKHIVQNNIF